MLLDAAQPFLLAEVAPPEPPRSGITPRPYQIAGIEAARRLIAEGFQRVLLALATGGGKTIIAALVGRGALEKGKRVLFVGPRREIIGQAFWKLVEAGIPEVQCGVIMANGIIPHAITREPYNARRPNAPVQVASIQTLQNRRLPPADVVFVDEAHHATSATWAKIIDHYTQSGARVVGLTATPCRADGAGLSKVFDHLHVIASFADLAATGHLVTPRVFTTPRAPDLSRVKLNSHGEYNQEQAAAVMRDRALVGDVVEHWKRHAEGRTTVVFAASVEHSIELRDAFRAVGVAADHVDANTDDDERDAALTRLARAESTVLCNMGIATEGWDLPRCKCVIIARPTKSLSLYLQMAGRGLRPWNDVSALLLDHAGVVHEHGFPSDDRVWSLDGRVKRKAAVAVRTCPECYAALPGGRPVCSECGFVFPFGGRESSLEQVDGELVEATAGEAGPKPPSMDERIGFYTGVLADAVRRGRKLGWARHRYHEKFGMWPAGPRVRAAEREAFPPALPEVPEIDVTPTELAETPCAAAPETPAPQAIDETPVEGLRAPIVAPRRARRIDLAALLGAATARTPEVETWSL